jgi:hypothetical protein
MAGLTGSDRQMNTEAIIATLLSAAGYLKHAVADVATQSIKDAFIAAKSYLHRKFGENSEASKALELATAKPESLLRKSLLAEESASTDLASDPKLGGLISCLANLLPPSASSPRQNVDVSGNGNHVQVAGRDLIHTARLVRRNAITPDERHLNPAQREKIRELVARLAARFPGMEKRGKLSAAYAMLQRRFGVVSYLLISSSQYQEAVAYLGQQCAIRRSMLRRNDPVAHRNDLYRVVFAGGRALGWDGTRVYRFAQEKLGLKNAVTSLSELGPVQLDRLAGFIRREAATGAAGKGNPAVSGSASEK